ncbi:MAG: acetate--CoA ligase family protein [archaeon]
MKKGAYTEVDTEKFLKKYVPVAKHKLCNNLLEVKSSGINVPLVLKIISKDALHKSDINGVRIVNCKEEIEKEFNDLVKIVKNKKLKSDGILVQEFVEGECVLIGLKKDDVFGHVVAFGIGGIYTEVMKDVSFRVCPITSKDFNSMVSELKMKDLLFGVRGKKGVNMKKLEKIVINISKIPIRYKEIKEMDINPFVINSKNGKVVDARMLI